MARVKRGVTTHARHKKVIKSAKGYYGARRKLYGIALQAVEKASSSIEHESTEFGNKTPSQRLRNVLYVHWEQTQPKQINPDNGQLELVEFDLFYKRQLKKIEKN